MDTDKSKIISFDSQGFPIHKLSLRDIISQLGFVKNEKMNKWEISDDNKILDAFPELLEDDGMGYGVNLENIIEISANREDNRIIGFYEHPMHGVEKFVEDGIYPSAFDRIKLPVDKGTSAEYYFVNAITVDGEDYYTLACWDSPEKILVRRSDIQEAMKTKDTVLPKGAKIIVAKQTAKNQ